MKLMVKEGGCRVFLKPGQGKTAAVLKAFDVLRNLGFVDTLLVIAPLRVVTTSWPQQLRFWQDFDHLTFTTIHGGREARRAAMKSKVDVYLMNVEGLLSTEWGPTDVHKGKINPVTGKRYRPKYVANPYAMDWLAGKKVMLVVDESTKFKDSSTSRFHSLKLYLPFINRRVILTGTPRPGKLEDLFSQCFITDLGADLGNFVTHFRSRYMQPDHSGYGWVEQPGASDRVAEKIAATTIQIETEEAVPLLPNDIWLPMDRNTKARYDELRKELLTIIQNQEVMAPNAGVLYGKLRQLAQGAIYRRDIYGELNSEEYVVLHDAKLDSLENLLEELNGEPAFCLYAYVHDIYRIRERLGYEVPYVGKGVSAKQGAAHCQLFATGTMPLLLGHPQSVAHGIDGLQDNCRNVIWFGGDPSWENTYQAQLRIARPGTKADSVTVHRIMMDCGIEKQILATVRGKQESEKEFLKSLREFLTNE